MNLEFAAIYFEFVNSYCVIYTFNKTSVCLGLFTFEKQLFSVIKFLFLLFLGLYIFRSLMLGLLRLFFNSVTPQKKKSDRNAVNKQKIDSSSVGEYVDYEEVD